MKLFGLTGGIGMGKSMASTLLPEIGIPVVDTDAIGRELVQPGQPALKAIAQRFGSDVLNEEGGLRRDVLGARVFADSAERQALNEILHPRIRDRWRAQVAAWREVGVANGVVVIPLLFEVGLQHAFDAVICVACTEATQMERLQARGWSRTHVEQRIRSQWPIRQKMEWSDYVIWTEGDPALHREQLRRILLPMEREAT